MNKDNICKDNNTLTNKLDYVNLPYFKGFSYMVVTSRKFDCKVYAYTYETIRNVLPQPIEFYL